MVDISWGIQVPFVLVLHDGCNYLNFLRMGELLSLMKVNIERYSGLFPELDLVWSVIIPWVVWQWARDTGVVEQVRRLVNAHMFHFMRNWEGVVVRHRQLEEDSSHHMRSDMVHLNKIGLEIFQSHSGWNRADFVFFLYGVRVLLVAVV